MAGIDRENMGGSETEAGIDRGNMAGVRQRQELTGGTWGE